MRLDRLDAVPDVLHESTVASSAAGPGKSLRRAKRRELGEGSHVRRNIELDDTDVVRDWEPFGPGVCGVGSGGTACEVSIPVQPGGARLVQREFRRIVAASR